LRQLSVTLLRHGLSTANHAGLVQGQKDYPLHEIGIAQVRRLCKFWLNQNRHFESILSSPLLRAQDTTKIISSTLSVPVTLDPLWMERRLGEAEGQPYAQMQELLASPTFQPTLHEPIFTDGESEWDLYNRASQAAQSLLELESNSCLVVSHGAILSAVLRAILQIQPVGNGRPPGFRFDNTGYTELTYDRETSRWLILNHNTHPHLG